MKRFNEWLADTLATGFSTLFQAREAGKLMSLLFIVPLFLLFFFFIWLAITFEL
jgi:hypothetical protein